MKKNSVWKIITEDLGMPKVYSEMVSRLLMMSRRGAACRCVRTSLSVLKMNQTCLEESITSNETWVLSTSPKPSSRALSGRLRHCRGQRKHDSQSQNSKSCWSHSSMWQASFTLSSYHRTRQSISKSTDKSCSVCFAHCSRRDKSCGRANCGCFTTTMRLLTMPWSFGSSWPKRKSPCWKNLPIQLAPCDFFLFPNLKGVIKGTRFEYMEVVKMNVTTELRDIPEESFQHCIEMWQRRMEKCIRFKGDYFEGETM